MGFRSTFTTEDYHILWPEWFRDKYRDRIWFAENGKGALHPKAEAKTYSKNGWADLPTDIHRAINWNDTIIDRFVLVYLHECGGITRCQIERDGTLKWSEPNGWLDTAGVSHSYCYGCSDL